MSTHPDPLKISDARRPPRTWVALTALLAREWRLEWRTKDSLAAMAAFAGIVVLIASFGISTTEAATHSGVQAVLLWLAFAFATTLAVGRALSRERESGAWQGLLLMPHDWSLIYAAKLISTWCAAMLTQIVTLAMFTVLAGLQLAAEHLPALLGVIAAVTLGHISLGLLLGAMTVNTRGRDILLPVVLLPLLIPLLLAAVRATSLVLSGFTVLGAEPEFWRWIGLIGAFDLAYLAVAVWLFPFVVR